MTHVTILDFHFGLGGATEAAIETFLPNEFHERIRQIAAYQLMTIREGVGLVAKNGWEALKQPYRRQGNGNRTKNPLTVVLHVF